jgi:RNA polymerase sigma factor (sigma-70 family)
MKTDQCSVNDNHGEFQMNQGDKLVEEILGGNLRAFDILVKDYERLVLFIVNKFVSERQDQEDLSQEVFIKVYYKLPTFRFNSKLSTWIAQIAYRTAINYLRKIKADRRVDINQDLDSVHIVEASPESILIKKDASAYLNYLIDQMPVNYKTVLTLYHLNEFS